MSGSSELVTQLLKVAIAYTRFFEECDDSVLDDDTALKQMEYAAYLLHQLSDVGKRRLVDELAALVAAEADPAERESVQGFAFGMGLVESEDG
ncbi:hypothetical protein GCM10023085_32360 [Actinomadura viridis]|uniref:Uncharacterized protein n=1 Tax=Actinomadura viridis TaxID=58110 RepID=A0A931GH07_9ACTN|nr:hypothetical protein [Actinomadura viridis]MBG6086915.1 hypothetical protein [Actinomadura viridis]